MRALALVAACAALAACQPAPGYEAARASQAAVADMSRTSLGFPVTVTAVHASPDRGANVYQVCGFVALADAGASRAPFSLLVIRGEVDSRSYMGADLCGEAG